MVARAPENVLVDRVVALAIDGWGVPVFTLPGGAAMCSKVETTATGAEGSPRTAADADRGICRGPVERGVADEVLPAQRLLKGEMAVCLVVVGHLGVPDDGIREVLPHLDRHRFDEVGTDLFFEQIESAIPDCDDDRGTVSRSMRHKQEGPEQDRRVHRDRDDDDDHISRFHIPSNG
ncbi:MAG: hypothetical protein ABFS86_19985, partial [Planctomycetota bacterium]